MNVSSQSLRRRQSLTNPKNKNSNNNNNLNNRPLRRGPNFKKRSTSSSASASASSKANDNDTATKRRSIHTINNANQRRHHSTTNTATTDDNHPSSSSSSSKLLTQPQPQSLPLANITACFSGQNDQVKSHLTTLITTMGGRTMGKFDPRYVTHLILDNNTSVNSINSSNSSSNSNKYDNWKRHVELGTDWAVKLKVVTSEWVVMCEKEGGRRVDEADYSLERQQQQQQQQDDITKMGTNDAKNGGSGNDTNNNNNGQQQQQQQQSTSLPNELQTATLDQKCDWILQHMNSIQLKSQSQSKEEEKYCHLFSRQSFILVGFDDDDNNHNYYDDDTTNNNNNNGNGSGSDGVNVERMGESHVHISNNNNENDEAAAAAAAESSRLPIGSSNATTFITKKQQQQSSTSSSELSFIHPNEHTTLKAKLSKLVRCAGGTIYWEPNEWISIVLLNDEGCDKETWDDVRYFCREHPKGPICVTVDWILSCIYHSSSVLLSIPPFPSEPSSSSSSSSATTRMIQKQQPQSGIIESNNSAKGGVTTNSNSNSNSNNSITMMKLLKKSSAKIFRGDVFTIIPSKNPTVDVLNFDSTQMQSVILDSGGLLLSKTLLLAIKKDAKQQQQQQQQSSSSLEGTISSSLDRKYYVISSRWLQLDCPTSFPLLAELAKVGIKVMAVSPIWVASCIENDCVYDPTEYPMLFQPQTWPIRLMLMKQQSSPASMVATAVISKKSVHGNNGGGTISNSSNTNTNTNTKVKFLFSVTGFVDSSRYGIITLLTQLGAEFTDNLSRKNTHLICKEAKGPKYTKALEWGLHVVSIEWLYHVVRYGYEEGSEGRFLISNDVGSGKNGTKKKKKKHSPPVVMDGKKIEVMERVEKKQVDNKEDNGKAREKVRSSLENGELDSSLFGGSKKDGAKMGNVRSSTLGNIEDDQSKSDYPTANALPKSNGSKGARTEDIKEAASMNEEHRATNQELPSAESPPSSQSSPRRRGKRERSPPQASPKEHRPKPSLPPKEEGNREEEVIPCDDNNNDPAKRLKFALAALEGGGPAAASSSSSVVAPRRNTRAGRMGGVNANSAKDNTRRSNNYPTISSRYSSSSTLSPRRRGKRDRSPAKQSQSLLSQEESNNDDDDDNDDEESQPVETQFTIGTIRANEDIGHIMGGRGRGGGLNHKRQRQLLQDDEDEVPLSQANDAEDNGESQVVWYAAPRG